MNVNLFVNITIFILFVIFFRKIVGRFIDSHFVNEPLLFGPKYLRGTDTDLVITANVLENPNNVRDITYNLWLNLENVGSSVGDISEKLIFNHNDVYKLSYNAEKSILYFLINNKKVPNCEIKVPQQKWINVNIGVKDSIVDFYLNGELHNSVQLDIVPPIPKGKITIICKECTKKTGGKNIKSGVYGHIDIFRYFKEYIEPQRVKDIYEAEKPEKDSSPSDNVFWWF